MSQVFKDQHVDVGGLTVKENGKIVFGADDVTITHTAGNLAVSGTTWDNIGLTRNAWFTAYAEAGASSGTFVREFQCPIKIGEKSDVLVSCKTLDDNCYVTAALRGWTETN